MAEKQRGKLRNGHEDNLKPLTSLDLSKVKTVNDLVTQMGNTAFGGRSVGEAADVFQKMVEDNDCHVVLTLSGAMTIAKMSLVICDMIDNGMIDTIVSTGALMAHGFVEAAGCTHFKYDPGMDDSVLYHKGYNRVYDTIELEKNLNNIEKIVEKVLGGIDRGTRLSSRLIHEKFGEYLAKNVAGRGILKSAYLKKVPVYVPAFTDSEVGLDVGIYNRLARLRNGKEFNYDPYIDLENYTEMIKSKKLIGIFTVGGGVPRNWAQQVGPYLDMIDKQVRVGGAFKRFQYGVRICPEPAHLGGLSGCTYAEGISWGKFAPQNEGGMWAEVYADATIVLPLIVKAVLERLQK